MLKIVILLLFIEVYVICKSNLISRTAFIHFIPEKILCYSWNVTGEGSTKLQSQVPSEKKKKNQEKKRLWFTCSGSVLAYLVIWTAYNQKPPHRRVIC